MLALARSPSGREIFAGRDFSASSSACLCRRRRCRRVMNKWRRKKRRPQKAKVLTAVAATAFASLPWSVVDPEVEGGSGGGGHAFWSAGDGREGKKVCMFVCIV